MDKIRNKNKGFVLWLTGLSCAGKTTVGQKVYQVLKKRGLPVKHLDGDIVRSQINKDLGFSKKDRDKNLAIVSSIAKSLNDQGNIVIASFISPYRKQREEIRRKIKNYVEIFVNAPLAVCEKRDKKGLYQKARLGQIKNFTGISDPYQPPKNPELVLKTDKESISQSVNGVIQYLKDNNYI